MAYFYKHIKGMATDLSIHKINWQEAANGGINLSYVPTFSTYTNNADTIGQNYGYFIVGGLNTGFSNKEQNIYTKLNVNSTLTVKGAGSNSANTTTIDENTISSKKITLSSSNSAAGTTEIMEGTIKTRYVYGNSTSELHVGLSSSGAELILGTSNAKLNKPFVVSDYCEAVYFNATSDKRAKTNIKPITLSALDYINSIPVYSFDYIQNNKPSIGIMAQDVLNQPIADFNLVENKDANGDGDFMSIRESKLVYILWKAVQELSAEVKELKEQLNK